MPCHHRASGACYPMAAAVGGAQACPHETEHCYCPCAAAHPCRKDVLGNSGQIVDQMCVALIHSFGVWVCPEGTVQCEHAYDDQHAAQFAPTPAPVVAHIVSELGHNVCRCGGDQPCHHGAANTCEAEVATGLEQGATMRCPSGAEKCHCDCATASRPCQHRELQICLPSYTLGGQQHCPEKSIMCDKYAATGPTPAPAVALCACGGNHPCQQAAAPHKCFARAITSSGAGACPAGTDVCDCPCLDAGSPCQYWNSALEKTFCFPEESSGADGVLKCPGGTTRCINSKKAIAIDTTNVIAPTDRDCEFEKDDLGNVKYTPWSACTVTCGTGAKARLPLIVKGALGSGNACPTRQEVSCDMGPCTAQDCEFDGWTEWSACSQNCHGGLMQSKPIVTKPRNRLGKACPLPRTRECNKRQCSPDLHCQCDPFARTLDPDAPPPTMNEAMCTRTMIGGEARVKVLHPPTNAYFKCAYRPSAGCTCCMCHLRECHDGPFSNWGDCQQYWVSPEGEKCPCPDVSQPCEDDSGICHARREDGTCPQGADWGSATCVGGRIVSFRERVRDVKSKVFLSNKVCPQLVVREMCGDWDTTAAAVAADASTTAAAPVSDEST
eukprot:g3239.t1